jgi:hypothetical protein
VGAALAALEKERAVVVVAVNNKEEVALFVAAVDPSQLNLSSGVLSTVEHGESVSIGCAWLTGVWGHSDMEPAKPHKQEEVMEL